MIILLCISVNMRVCIYFCTLLDCYVFHTLLSKAHVPRYTANKVIIELIELIGNNKRAVKTSNVFKKDWSED